MALKLTDLGRRLFGGELNKPKTTRGTRHGQQRDMSPTKRRRRKVRRQLQAEGRHHNRHQRRGQRRG